VVASLVSEATAEQLAASVRVRFGISIDVKFVPIVRETLRQKQLRDAFDRKRAAQATAQTTAPCVGLPESGR
jgi:hypothetical protein